MLVMFRWEERIEKCDLVVVVGKKEESTRVPRFHLV